MKLPVNAIQTEGRHRSDLGDLRGLAESIERVGLLHPIVVTSSGRLVAGGRRLAACASLGWGEIPVTVADSLSDARALLEAERDENVCRKDMSPAEKVALGRALEELERPAAAERKARPGQPREEKFSSQAEPSRGERTGKVYDLVGEAVGMSGPTYKRAKAVVDAAALNTPGAAEALEQMERTGKVTPAYNAIQASEPARTAPASIDTVRGQQQAQAHKRRVYEVVSTLTGFARGIDSINVEHAAHAMKPGEMDGLADQLAVALTALRKFRNTLKESA